MSSDLAPHALAPGTQIRDYTIVSVIGTGGFSIVYKALDNSLQREVAIKEYFPGALALRDGEGGVHPHSRDAGTFSKGIESFLNEGKLLAAFDHPALVRVYRCWEERGTAYLAMRLYTGVTLRDAVIAGNWYADEASLHALLAPMCDALDLLHASRCYHRDVAPDNIMLVDAGTRWAPVLLDFGAARKAIESTQVFTAILKPGYAPIEQYGDGELKQGPWTDIYALAGVVHFTLAAAAPPTAISRMIRDAMPRPRDAFAGRLPEHWLDAIETALGVKPEQRPATITEFRELFRWDEWMQAVPETVIVPPPVAPPPAARAPVAPIPAPPPPPTAPASSALPAQASVQVPVIADVPTPSSTGNTVDITSYATPDDDRTVVMSPRAVAAQLAAASAASVPSVATTSTAPATFQPHHMEGVTRSTGTPRLMWIIGVAVLLALAALIWKQSAKPAASTSPPVVAPAAPVVPVETKAQPPEQAPLIAPANDTIGDKKTSVSPEAPAKVSTEAPRTATVAPPVVKQPATKAAAEKAKEAKEAKGKPSRKADAEESDGEDRAPSRAVKRSDRCASLVERYGLGEMLSAEDQRFIRESCR